MWDAGAVVKTLLERHLIRIAGQREVPGRPMLYATSRRFLEVFGLDDLKGLPTLRELDELAREQGLLEPEVIDLSEASGEEAASADEVVSDSELEIAGAAAEDAPDADLSVGDDPSDP